MEELVNHLQTRYSEYSRRKRRAFKLSVEKVYDAISKDREEDKHLQELEERFLQKRKHSPDFRDLNDSNNNDDDSDDEKGSDNKSLELSSDSELSLGDEPLMEIQDTNMMNQSMQSMYKATSSHPTSEDEGDFDQATDPSKSNEKKDMFSPESGSLHMDQSHSASLNTSYQNEERSLSKMGTPDEPQLSMQDNKSLNDPELSSKKSLKWEKGKRREPTTPKKTKKSLQKDAKDKQAEDTGVGNPFHQTCSHRRIVLRIVLENRKSKSRELFARAVAHAPCVLFLDEIDSITPKRETASKDMERRIVSQLLTCMDDLNSNPDAHVLVIGATNRPDSLDPALRRAGRFDREISMGIPDEKARERILRVLCQKLRLEEEFRLRC
ncbi:hypothetical protein OS493_035782 [Desmophyllum pertusum]|uniref:Uncharacterized protein n=1 Tax=Desmophyllum pertusum TaxID=174260 RepID=A0A9W9YID8_9CNID|nr:hypothetical protein OS493_035782 [Desmophyllum pertusum]